ncbi:hypothetical protein M434DRAFT_400608 [Hypoxylon sp. CO27-5]|nr:hypothetical protein M434DRAFT_400608 [Hypoxylon sp. CO27-5]
MTKQWDVYEATIKDLYAENTLSVVRQIMIDQYGFKASVRAYRGRLIRWGVRKYNCRKRSSSSSSGGSAGSANEAGFSSGSDTSSPTMTATAPTTTTTNAQGITTDRRLGPGHLAMPGRMTQPYNNAVVDSSQQPQIYSSSHHADNPYETKPKVLLSPPLSQSSQSSQSSSMQYAWDSGSPPLVPASKRGGGNTSAPDLNGFGGSGVSISVSSGGSHHAEVMAPPSYFGGYGAPVPMSSNPYASPPNAGYEGGPASGHRGGGGGGAGSSGMGYYDSRQRGRDNNGGQMPDGLPYPSAVRDYGHGG